MTNVKNDTNPERLTYRALRAHALILGLCGWGLAVWALALPGAFDRFGTLKGVDFLQFYVAGSFLADGNGAGLYDWSRFAAAVRSAVPGTGDLLFVSVYPPQLALLFAPFTFLSYLQALSVWSLVSVTLYALCARTIAGSLGLSARQRRVGYLLAFAAVPFQQLVLHGQVGVLVLLLVTAGWLAFRRGRWWWLGVALGSLVFKPQFGTMAVAALVAAPSWRLLAGIAAGGVGQLALVALVAGPGLLVGYLDKAVWILEHPGAIEPKVWQTHSLRGFFELLVGNGPVGLWAFGLAAVGVLILLRLIRARQRSPELRYAAIVTAGLLLDPHLYVYDLVVLLIPLALIARWALDDGQERAPGLVQLAYGLYWLPLVAPLASLTHVQLTAPAMAALLVKLRAAPARPIVHHDTAPPTDPAADAWPPATPAAARRS